MVSRSAEDASLGFGGDSLMRRERDHYFRSLKRSPEYATGGARSTRRFANSNMARDHYFRSLKRSDRARDHYFRSLKREEVPSPPTYAMEQAMMEEPEITTDELLQCVRVLKNRKRKRLEEEVEQEAGGELEVPN